MTATQVSSIWRLAAKRAGLIVPLAGDGDRSPFFCVHSISGDVSTLQPLANELALDRRVYGIQIPKRLMNGEFASSVGLIAERYVDALTAVQPDGPILLGGWSAGAFIALEMAQILRRRERCVALLVVLDGFLYRKITLPKASYPHYFLQFAQNLPGWVQNQISNPNLARKFERGILKRSRRATPATGRHTGACRPSSEVDKFLDTSGWPDQQAAFIRILFDTIERYEPQRYSGRTVVYSAKVQHLFRPGQVKNQWKNIADSVEFVDVNGAHVAMTREPDVFALGAHLRKCFREVDALTTERCSAPTLRWTSTRS